jgi:Arm DNA-binding domain/Phage integrase, N-terminal SAM-like domain/Phage integrase family
MARGSVFRRSGRWAYRVDAGFQPDTGKRRQMLKQGFATKKEAEVALAEAIRDVSRGSAVSKSSMKVDEFLNDWLLTVKSGLRPTTWYSYEMVVTRINAHLGRYSLRSLTPLQIEKFYADLLATGSYKGEELAPKTVRNTHVVLRKALSGAERLGLVIRNAASSAQLAAGPGWERGSDLVFRNEIGNLVNPDVFSRGFKKIIRSLDVPIIRLHDLRHTYATLALKAGVHPKVVSERLGHATVGVTLDLYSHVAPSIAREAADVVASRIYQQR